MMLARVKWQGDIRLPNGRGFVWEYGTLLGFLHKPGSGIVCLIAGDGQDQHDRGKIIEKMYQHVTVTTWFKWSSNDEVLCENNKPG